MSVDELADPEGVGQAGPLSSGERAREGSGEVDAIAASSPCPSPPGFSPDFAEKLARAGVRHPEGCRCTRCVGFTPGPDGTAITRMTHGTRSMVEIQGRAGEVAEVMEQTLREEQMWRESFAPTVHACAIVLVRLERAHAALDQMDEHIENPLAAYLERDGDPFGRLRQDAARWANVARGYLNDLGLTPRSLAAIAKDTGIARSTRAATALAALTEHVEREHTAA